MVGLNLFGALGKKPHFAGGVSDTDADGLLKTVRQFAVDVEAWIYARYPHLA
jgi:hypothetical protein